jgi:hypothetical protein
MQIVGAAPRGKGCLVPALGNRLCAGITEASLHEHAVRRLCGPMAIGNSLFIILKALVSKGSSFDREQCHSEAAASRNY